MPFTVHSQELRCNISVSSQKVQGTNRSVFNTLQAALYEFMNNRPWTSNAFGVNERIDCNILINVDDMLGDEFSASIQIQSRRPVFNSSYNTTMFNFLDNSFKFKYVEFDRLEFVETNHTSNLTSVLAYYAYIILGLDYDSFSPEGGTEFFKKAETIVSNAQGSSDIGWRPYDGKNNRNRYWLVKNLLDKNYSPLRDFMYKYHRQGLDVMSKSVNEGRTSVFSSLELLQKVYRSKPDPYMFLLQIIFDAKSDEFVNVYSEGMPDEKSRAFNLLNEINNANANKYEKIMKPSS